MIARSTRIRLVAMLAAFALFATACGGGSDEPASGIDTTTETASSETAESAEPDPTATPEPTAEPTAIPEPTATTVPTPEPEPTEEPEPEPTAEADEDLGAGDAALRSLAITEMMSGEDGVDEATAECMVDAVFDETGSFAPSDEEALEALPAIMLCAFSTAFSPELLTEAAIEEGHPAEAAECLGIKISEMFSAVDFSDSEMSAEDELAFTEDINTCGEPLGAATGDAAPGDNPDLDPLWDECSDGVALSCQSLYNVSQFSEELEAYNLFAASCGGRVIVEIDCGLWIDGEALEPAEALIAAPATGSAPPGTDADLDALWEACTAESGDACDSLYFESPIGSDYEAYGFTCGGRVEGGTSCNGDGGGPLGFDLDAIADPGSAAPGDDAVLDALWDACGAEDGDACDNLYYDSPLGSDYEAYGYTCGGRVEGYDNSCTNFFEDN